ncbi:MAG: hypothetical protein JOZ69_08650 [Myxococcales bacterium]|nr:hypothetical protein [Myxococcales bacterium]
MRAPSAWGAARDALAAVRNLETLLRSPTVAHRTILDLLPELRSGAGVLLGAFEPDRVAADAATAAVSAYGKGQVEELARLLDATTGTEQSREELASRAHGLADELEASADLLALLERSSAPVRTEVSPALLVRETSRMSGSASGRELLVRFDDGAQDCVVTTDPYVVGSLVRLAIGWAHAGGLAAIAVRARCTPPLAILLVEAATPADAALPVIGMRVLPSVPPAEEAAHRVADRIGATLQIEVRAPPLGPRFWLQLPASSV